MLQIINHTSTVDTAKVEISHPGVSEAVTKFENLPLRGMRKAHYLRPSDQNYRIVVTWRDYKDEPGEDIISKPAGGVEGTKTFDLPLPLPREVTNLHIYRGKDGVIIVDQDIGEHDDDFVDPETGQDPTEGEGSVPAIIPPYNRDKMGTFVVMNMTKDRGIKHVGFSMAGKTFNITPPAAETHAVGPRDQRSIALGQGAWATVVDYYEPVPLGPRNSVVIAQSDPMSLRSNYLYFYKTHAGSFDLTYVWPPVPNDAADDSDSPLDLLDNNQGILEIVNKSVTHTVVKGVRINGVTRMEYPDYLYLEQSEQFVVDAGISMVRFFTDKTGGDYGQANPVRIKPRAVTRLVYYDTLGQPYSSGMVYTGTFEWEGKTVQITRTDETDGSITLTDTTVWDPGATVTYEWRLPGDPSPSGRNGGGINVIPAMYTRPLYINLCVTLAPSSAYTEIYIAIP